MAAGHGEAIGVYAAALLDNPLPWTKMRQVYALLGLVKKWGGERVEAACRSSLDHEVVNIGLIGRCSSGAPKHPLSGRRCPARSSRLASPATPTTSPSEPRIGRIPISTRLVPTPPTPPQRPVWREMWPGRPSAAVAVSPELKALLRRVKLGRCLDTLRERLALAQTGDMGHAEFLELFLADEVTRREATSADLRARAAGLDSSMRLELWDETARVSFDRAIWKRTRLVALRRVRS
jgi:hypothetical protein